jgi:CMP-N,N'-diacetyllegionaminic acid synthase
MPSIVALVPARTGSQRIPNKNFKDFCGRPMIEWTLLAAQESGIFADIAVSTDRGHVPEVKLSDFDAGLIVRPAEFATNTSPDIEWVRHALEYLGKIPKSYDCFAILRPTSPFRTADTIRRAWAEFQGFQEINSLRAIDLCGQHPFKMWELYEGFDVPSQLIRPFAKESAAMNPPGHSQQYGALPQVYAQNGSLEIAWTKTVTEKDSIAGDRIAPFFTEAYEGHDINTTEDWILAEALVERGLVDIKSPEKASEGGRACRGLR